MQKIKQSIRGWRRHLHQHPELSGQEKESASFISDVLKSLSVEHQGGIGGHGLVAWLNRRAPGPTLALRADFDALPLPDRKTTEYASRRPGVMHACGHDGHAAVLMGVAAALKKHPEICPGPVQLIFQPGEETGIGAQAMIDDGVLNPPPAAIFGFHFFPAFATGQVCLHHGTFMAATEHFTLTVRGRSSHACMPEKSVDAIQVAIQLIQALNQLVCKRLDPIDPALISIGTINGGHVANIIADEVVMTGTIRSLSSEQHQRLHTEFRKLLQDLPRAFDAEAELEISQVAPALSNDPRLYHTTATLLKQLPGVSSLELKAPPSLGGEDFARFAARVPGCYFFIGCGNQARGLNHPLHSPLFDIDEDALDLAFEILVEIVRQNPAAQLEGPITC